VAVYVDVGDAVGLTVGVDEGVSSAPLICIKKVWIPGVGEARDQLPYRAAARG
jgi:hypothetical protein